MVTAGCYRWIDGGHKRDRYATDVLATFFEWVPVCPEVDVGMGMPREPIRLIKAEGGPRLVGVNSGEDWTERMASYAERKVEKLAGSIPIGAGRTFSAPA